MKRKPWSVFIKPSTQDFFRAARRTPGYSLFDLLHGYVYARWPYLYIGIGVGEHPLVKKYGTLAAGLVRLFKQPPSGNGAFQEKETDGVTFADGYHGKVMPLDSVKRLVMVGEEIALPDLEQVIPYKRARDIILRNPDHIVALQCPCRSARPSPCLPLDVCLIVGEPFASFVVEHHPERSRWISQEEAAGILQAEDERGHVHHAFFKDAMLGRFYAICNCCACCCGAMQSHRRGTPMLASSGYLSHVDEELCIGCAACEEYCQFEALTVPNGSAIVDKERCMGCGVCVSKCDQGALSLERALQKGEPLEILDIMARVVE
jgi:ferredoxin